MTLVFLDTETTGLDPDLHDVWEIAYAIDDGPILSSVVDHDATTADPVALELNGYWGANLAVPKSLPFEIGLREALAGATLVGANPAFDAAFLRRRWGSAPWAYRLLDVEAYAMPALGFDRPLGLARIAEAVGVEAPDHTAAQDVRTLRSCYLALSTYYEAKGIAL